MLRATGLACLVMVAGGISAQPATAGSRGLLTGFSDPRYLTGPNRDEWLQRSRGAGAGMVRISVSWSNIAPHKPANPKDPGDPAYHFAPIDAAVTSAHASGLRVLLTVYRAPPWAEGAHRPGSAPAGSWRPRAGPLGDFAHAIAERYTGSFASLPRVKYFQAWNEPTIPGFLSPQWNRHRKPVAPTIYRKMLNAFYSGVHAVQAHARVLSAGLAPYGDPPGRGRMRPVTFLRNLLCLRGHHKLHRTRCHNPAHLDILDDHPIDVGSPHRSAINRDDASTPDLRRLTRVLHAAEHKRTVLPHGRRPVWATEIWWESRPPDRTGVSLATQARFLEEALHILWQDGASAVFNYQIGDSPVNGGNGRRSYQTGLYFTDGTPKPAPLTAFRFPFVANKHHQRVRVWGKSPAEGALHIEHKAKAGWRTVKRLNVHRGAVFTAQLHLHGRQKLRARVGSATSLAWHLHP